MQSTTDEVIAEWTWEAAAATDADRRQNGRHPFFRAVTITLGGAPGTKFSAFSRDISRGGIGLLHNVPLETHQVTLAITTTKGHRVDIRSEIKWCEPCGDGWYLSGGRFLGLSSLQATKLLLATVTLEASQRLKQRHPFFRPLTITLGGAPRTKIPAFSRDISPAGIGLFHNTPLETQRVILTLPRTADEPIDISTEIMWCQPCCDGWYLSGGRFVRLTIEELPDLLL